MSFTVYNGPPGAGKSHALVKELIVPAVMLGRRVLSNIAGLNADAIVVHCLSQMKVPDATKLGEIVLFHGDDALKPGFFPDETNPDGAVVQAGDLVVFDEWALTFPSSGPWPKDEETGHVCNVEAFLRWHRHMTGVDGTATDVACGTQSFTDLHRRIKFLVVKSFVFKKLDAIGMDGSYSWFAFDGSKQRNAFQQGSGKYDKAIFPLYASSAAAGTGTKHVELRPDKKSSIWSGSKVWWVILGSPALLLGGGYMLVKAYNDTAATAGGVAAADGAVPGVPGAPPVPGAAPGATAPVPVPVSSPWRIVGYVEGEFGMRVVVSDSTGATRMLRPDTFDFDEGRPVSGLVDGQRASSEDRLPVAPSGGGVGSAVVQ